MSRRSFRSNDCRDRVRGLRTRFGAFTIGIACLLVPRPAALALGPHELLIVANGRSVDSVALAKFYAALRGVPDANLVRVTVPTDTVRDDTISHEDFERYIWEPANRAVRERGVADIILAWAYSTDMPVRVRRRDGPDLSITGLTFVQNRPPEADAVKFGRYASPLFGGPINQGGHPHRAQSLDAFREWLGGEMPLPAMLLGYGGFRNGNSPEAIQDCLRRGTDSDGSFPRGPIYFVQTDDVRSRARSWQHGGAVDDLRSLGLDARIIEGPPPAGTTLLGLQIGEAQVHPERYHYLPGAMAEHLTSAAAVFHTDFQTKTTRWIAAGATASAGTVTEPFDIWTKFPSAHFYYFYASGVTVLESFYQSIRCPLQILPIGEPLAAPWTPRGRIELDGVIDGALPAGTRRVTPHYVTESGTQFARFRYYVDDRRVDAAESLALDSLALTPGEHALRVVAYSGGLVRHQTFVTCAFVAPAPEPIAGESAGARRGE